MAQPDSDSDSDLLVRAFDLVDELNRIQNKLSKEYSLKIDSVDVSTMVNSHSVYSFRLTIGRNIERPRKAILKAPWKG